MCYMTGKYTVLRQVRTSFSPEILQTGAVKGLNTWAPSHRCQTIRQSVGVCHWVSGAQRHEIIMFVVGLSLCWSYAFNPYKYAIDWKQSCLLDSQSNKYTAFKKYHTMNATRDRLVWSSPFLYLARHVTSVTSVVNFPTSPLLYIIYFSVPTSIDEFMSALLMFAI